jgi:hypothetical protein
VARSASQPGQGSGLGKIDFSARVYDMAQAVAIPTWKYIVTDRPQAGGAYTVTFRDRAEPEVGTTAPQALTTDIDNTAYGAAASAADAAADTARTACASDTHLRLGEIPIEIVYIIARACPQAHARMLFVRRDYANMSRHDSWRYRIQLTRKVEYQDRVEYHLLGRRHREPPMRAVTAAGTTGAMIARERESDEEYAAIICNNGDREWWYLGQRHRAAHSVGLVQPPAVISSMSTEWWLDGKRHHQPPACDVTSQAARIILDGITDLILAHAGASVDSYAGVINKAYSLAYPEDYPAYISATGVSRMWYWHGVLLRKSAESRVRI